ncbi:metal-dependent phosphohydrolase [Roseofilum casamattae]|uniref:Metal-dependent phosphohydrolase n=1 Tax=Roseofilum casamattae BLCC-M143 TaxID=3022442 RepID=A0ABT7BZ38_9CYAN|nr:metal-dependent phosphohydrolase [Roseofilum casamattae]MDJ1184057.1 metal-dependent phosphohydrolase [Roseofilum casamattae BLCC-M143]
MSSQSARRIRYCIQYLKTAYRFTYGKKQPDYADLIATTAAQTLEAIARSDAAYHNLDHTMQVALVGQEILRGKYCCEENISSEEWTHFILSLLCHDIGYIKGICQGDRPEKYCFVTGVEDNCVTLLPHATGASLTPFHVDRSQLFVAENFSDIPLIDIKILQKNIELTRFPVPQDKLHSDIIGYPGLTRAADLIGQLSDPNYLTKIPALFQEFEETGGNKIMGYRKPEDVRASYPKFYWNIVSNYIHHGIRYLEATLEGQPVIENLYNNVRQVEKELTLAVA